MEVIHQYNLLSNINSLDKKKYQPFYSTSNIKIIHNKNEILVHYNKKYKKYDKQKSK